MLTPFEELEYLAEFLPNEGEAVVVTRRGGELRCEPLGEEDLRDGIDDVELYGRLVQANERLNAQGTLPLWATALGASLLNVLYFRGLGLGWGEWYLVPLTALFGLYVCFHWIRRRQHRFFEGRILPALAREARLRRITLFGLMAGVRQHAEFRTLLDELVRTDAGTREW